MNKHKNSRKKSAKLRMPYNNARRILLKSILFDLIKKLNLDICYRCNQKIEIIEELSIEHKEAWLNSDNPIEKFFDLNNIAFSHLRCNKREILNPKHGTHSCYNHRHCRCQKCTIAHRKMIMNNRKKNGRKKYPVHSIQA